MCITPNLILEIDQYKLFQCLFELIYFEQENEKINLNQIIFEFKRILELCITRRINQPMLALKTSQDDTLIFISKVISLPNSTSNSKH